MELRAMMTVTKSNLMKTRMTIYIFLSSALFVVGTLRTQL